MALRVIDGVPGSGKTFYAVWHLADHYFKKSELTGLYHPSRDCLIITNIDGFKPDHVSLQKEIEIAGAAAREKIESSSLTERRKESALEKLDPVAEFFSYEYQEHFKEGKSPLVYVIDEAQRYFRKGMDRVLKERRVFDYFEYHRHWGQDIYLVTQNVKKLPADIVYLPEYIVCAVPRSRSIGFGFKYNWVSSGEIIKTETRRIDPEIFALYQSMDVDEQEKIKNPLLKKIGLYFLVSFVVLFFGYRYFSGRYSRPEPPASLPAPVSETATPSPSPSSGGSYIPVGKAREVKLEPHYFVFVPLSSVKHHYPKDVRAFYVWRGQLIPTGSFPHKTVSRSGQRYAVLDYDLYAFMFGDEELPPNVIVQASDGSGTDDRSAARSDLSVGQARRGV